MCRIFDLQEQSGHTCVLVAVCGVLVAAVAITDPLKPEAAAVVAALQGMVGVAFD
jgi:Cu+-exporting ATPase